jgi:hypothetical protein
MEVLSGDVRDGKPCHNLTKTKCIEVVNGTEVVHRETLTDGQGIDVQALVLRLLTAKHGDSARAIFDANETKARGYKRGGRKLGSKNRATLNVTNEAIAERNARLAAKRKDPEYKRALRKAELQAKPSLRRKRDRVEGGLLHGE